MQNIFIEAKSTGSGIPLFGLTFCLASYESLTLGKLLKFSRSKFFSTLTLANGNGYLKVLVNVE